MPNIPPSTTPMIVALLLLAHELGVEEAVGVETKVGGELEMGNDAEGRNEDVALQKYNRFPTYFVYERSRQDPYLALETVSVIDSMSNRVGRSDCINVTPKVVVWVSGIFTATMRLMEVLSCVVIETSVGSAVNVRLTVAFEKEVVRRYREEADYGRQSWTRCPSGQTTSEIEEHLWYHVACLWYRAIGVNDGSSGYSVVRYLPEGWQSVVRERNSVRLTMDLCNPL